MQYPIPPSSMARIQTGYAQFEQLTAVIAEAMGIDITQPYQLDLQGKCFVTQDPPARQNGIAALDPVPAAALSEPTRTDD